VKGVMASLGTDFFSGTTAPVSVLGVVYSAPLRGLFGYNQSRSFLRLGRNCNA
jgi:hypothetical protein